ncbi:hypothetical protein [Nocardia coubleae]|uniref:Lipoprotein n=1 Tax=Nocardia coubleae TaxID=356147 RepID=A0A846W2X4_9NOCA|nr:hypothetical protein [Nocardia coubleae]NKX87539.1 hypothetical protein [Nocardia coubleae]
MRARKRMSCLLLALVAITPVAGCSSSGGEQIAVQDGSPALTAAFARLLEEKRSARLGDIVASSGAQIGPWDRMYSFSSPNTSDELNRALGTDGAKWTGLHTHSESTTQVFVHAGKVVLAYDDRERGPIVKRLTYATPDSLVSPKSAVTKGIGGEQTIWYLEVQGFS